MALRTWLRSRLLQLLAPTEDVDDAEEDEFDPDDPDNWLGLDYVHDQTLEKLTAQYEAWNVVDGRLRLVLGVIGIIFAAALGLQRSTAPIPFWVGVLAILAMVLFLLAGVLVAGFTSRSTSIGRHNRRFCATSSCSSTQEKPRWRSLTRVSGPTTGIGIYLRRRCWPSMLPSC